jgi:2-oxoisovalerate dehydrogenase E2 component (dihydrolipoyl transacylase)
MRGIKAAMAKQMLASVTTIPHFTVSDELVMDELIALRQALKPQFEKEGVKLSFMPFFIKALSLALHEFPVVNSRLNKDETELHYLRSHNIGMAVDSKIGLLVPNIKNVQNLSLFEVAKECDRIIASAREGKLSNADLSNGTISISNIGAIGGMTATPVINKPEVAIVALGKTQKLPRFDETGEVFAQSIMMLNWSGDHRVIDGATMVRFNNLWMSYLQSPQLMLMHLK